MKNWIENLRGKSENYRRGVSFSISFIITILIAGVWVTTSFPTFTSGLPILARNKEIEGPVSNFRRNVAQSFGAVKIQWNSLGKYVNQVNYVSEPQLQAISPEQKEAEVRAEMMGNAGSTDQKNTDNKPTNKDDSVLY